MTTDHPDEVSFWFTVVGLKPEDSQKLKQDLSMFEWESGRYHADPSLAVESTRLLEGKDYRPLIDLLNSGRLKPLSQGLFVQLTSFSSDTGIEFPDFVLDLYRSVGGRIDVSIFAGLGRS